MFVEDIKNDFYNVLLGNRVLLLVHYDVDAICTCKILQGLFRCDNISYTLVPVGGIAEMKTAYEENNEEIKYVVLVNCGGTVDLVDILQPEEDVVFFVLDSHKPTDICNVYSNGQVRLVYKDDEENIPDFDDIFKDDEDNEEEIDGRDLEAVVERRRAKKAWEDKRHRLMFNYTEFSYYGKPSACIALDLAARWSRCTGEVLWAASVASAAHSALHCRPPARCLLDAEPLHRHVAALRRNEDTEQRSAQVVVEKDAWLPLYRWWSLEAALRHSSTFAPRLRLHARSGAARLRQLLADMGFPLQQARQFYRSMDVELRRALLSALEAAAPKHKLPAPTRATFLLQRPHAPVVAALDTVYAIMALIEHETLPKGEGFQLALAALEVSGENESWRRGVTYAKRALEAVASLAHSTLSSQGLLLAGPFSYFIVQEGTPEAALVRGPLWLGEAARWVAGAVGAARPVLASAPLPGGTCLLLGLPPRFDQEPRNLLGAAFEQAAAKSGASVSLDHVDTSVVSLPASQRAQFLDALTALLA